MIEARDFEALCAGRGARAGSMRALVAAMALTLAWSGPAGAQLLPQGKCLLGRLQPQVSSGAEQICSLLVGQKGLPGISFGTSAKTACTNLLDPVLNLLAPVLGCGHLSAFDPRTSAAYDDYPVNGELQGLEYRSYLACIAHPDRAGRGRTRSFDR